ncbi:MAG: 1,4-alpha-glucan branching protein GlgB [Candidatus Izimaplasma sp.]|nr:1,4-alpha-glucan branching protein GlgB [Candidatus Izimaplasma bacterium]
MAINEDQLYYFNKGELINAYDVFGAHLKKDEAGTILGTQFTVWAPHAKEVSVLGEFNDYQAWVHNLTKIDDTGIWSIFIESATEWHQYKYEIKTHDQRTLYKSDPYAFFSADRPSQMSKIYDIDGYKWEDQTFMNKRDNINPYESQISIYELHLGSWMTKPDGSFHKYNELVDKLISYLKDNGFTHVEFMPIIEHPLDQSWGYQGTGYYSATSRFGVPKDLMYLIDQLHQANIPVILDWVPGHICRDEHGLYLFDGEPLYDYAEEWKRENIVWGTANLDLGKGEVQSFLISNALFWMKYFHVDGFRIDAVSNLIFYLGNPHNGVNDGAIDFLHKLSRNVFKEFNHTLLIAEDSSAHPKVTHPIEHGGLGFNFKWNMGWMNDTLEYFEKDPVYRKFHHHELTFSLDYAFSENYILPLSHDEVVHGKHSLVNKMPGDYWQKFANLRALMGLFFTHPGKTLLFMGGEFAQMHEWKDYTELDWNLLSYPMHDSARRFVRDMNLVVKNNKSLYELDSKAEGFAWIDGNNSEQSVLSFIRYAKDKNDFVVVVLNLTPIVHHNFRIGVPKKGTYKEIINSDKDVYSGSNQFNGEVMHSQKQSMHGFDQSIQMVLAPLSISILKLN